MRYFIDSEFYEDGQRIWPISLGVVREDRSELYMEFVQDFEIPEGHWVQHNVLPHLTWKKEERITPNEGAYRLLQFVGEDRKPEFWAYFCVAPETKVLAADLTWKSAGDVSVGDTLIGFDEEGEPGSGRSKKWRQWKPAQVTETRLIKRPCYDLMFSDGTRVRCSSDHQWLVYSGYAAAEWVTTENLVAGGPKTKSQVVKPLNVWDLDNTRAGGYLAAALDGEGHLTQRDLSRGGRVDTFQTRIGFAQRDNAMLSEVEKVLAERGIRFTKEPPSQDVYRLSIGNRSDVFKVLGSIRPHRLLDKFDPASMGAMSLETVQLVEKQFVGMSDVSAITTTTGTYIAEGLASHNCSYDWVLLCQMFGTMVELPRHFPQFCMDIQQWWIHLGRPHMSKVRPTKPDNEHNALADARWNFEYWTSLRRWSLTPL